MKKRLIGALTSIPTLAATAMSGTYAVSCPYGLVNCPYPGQCRRYMDADGDGLCDLSLAEVNAQTPDTSQSTGNTSTVDNSDPAGVSDYTTTDQNTDLNPGAITDSGTDFNSAQIPDDTINYHVLPISILLLSGYFFTYYLFKKGILKQKKHRRIWNLLLTLGYIGTGATGIVLTFMINMGILIAYRQSLNFWHVELAILMVISTLIHFHIYRKPFKNMFKVLFNFRSSAHKKEFK